MATPSSSDPPRPLPAWPVGSDVRAVLVFAGALALALLVVPPRTDDLDWHLAVGRDIVRDGTVPRVNRYSFTAPDAPWIHHGWGGSVILHLTERAGGFAALVLFAGLLYAASVTLVFLRSRSLPWTVAASLLLLAAHALKPDAIATALAALLVWLLDDSRPNGAGRWRSRVAPVVILLWANVHGSFPIGLALVAAADLRSTPDGLGAWRRSPLGAPGSRRLPWRTATAGLLCVANPYGVSAFLPAWRYAFDPRLRSFLRDLGVWQPPSGAAAVVAATAMILALLLSVRSRPRIADVVIASLAAIAAWLSVRHVAIFAVVAGAIVASSRRVDASRCGRRALVTGAILVLIVLAAHLADPPRRPDSPFPASLLAEPRPARLLHPHAWGGALLAAGVPIAIDPRNDCYPQRVRDAFLALHRSPKGLEAFVRRYRIDGALVPSGGRMDRGLRDIGFRPIRERLGASLLTR